MRKIFVVGAVLATMALGAIFATGPGADAATAPDFLGMGCVLIGENTYPYPDIGVGSECGPMPGNWPDCWVWDEIVGRGEDGMVIHEAATWFCPEGVDPCK